MTKLGKIILFLGILLVLVLALFLLQRPPSSDTPLLEDAQSSIVAEYDTSLLEGNVQDLVYLSITANAIMPQGILSYQGSVKGGYFFEGNVLINILDSNYNVLKASNAVAKTDWMTVEPVEFEGNIDFTGLPAGSAYFEIHNDNASGEPEYDKYIRVPILIQ